MSPTIVTQPSLFQGEGGNFDATFRSPIRWAGSKRSILPSIVSNAPSDYRNYIEPFAGSASVFFGMPQSQAVISDSNRDLINFFIQLQQYGEKLHDLLLQLDRTEERYYELRSEIVNLPYDLERAVIFLFLNRNCFNGLYRTNLDGVFNVPFAKNSLFNYPTRQSIDLASKKLNGVKICCADFADTIEKYASKGTFIYLDPPYYVEDKRVFREYGINKFSMPDFERLCVLLEELNDSGVEFLLSYPKCSVSDMLTDRWNSTVVLAKRKMAANVKQRVGQEELLVKNY